LPHAAAKATEAAAPEAAEAATTASTRCKAGTPTYGYACGKLAQRVPEGSPMLDVRRRQFITLLGGAAAAWPLAARAQQQRMPVIGYLNVSSPGTNPHFLPAFLQGLGEVGYVEGKNVAMEYRWAEDQYGRLPAMATDLVRQQVAVIAATGGPPAALAAKAATITIPIVFTSGADPVAAGLVASLGRPGGNVTGMSLFYAELAAKRLGLLRELIPTADVIAFLVNPNFVEGQSQLKDVLAAAHIMGQQLVVANAANEGEIDTAFATLVSRQARGLLVASDPFFAPRRHQIIALAARHAIPGIYHDPRWVAEGALMSYGIDTREMYRQAGIYVGRILKGAKPADLPVMQPTKFELAINLKTAKALGLDVPPTVLARADEVIE
jgi:putative ABC transport system substrate-binding protein